MVTFHLKEFEKNTRALPDTIIFFRDGVSESVSDPSLASFLFSAPAYVDFVLQQYAAIVDIECKAIMDAASKIKKGYKPKLTCKQILFERYSSQSSYLRLCKSSFVPRDTRCVSSPRTRPTTTGLATWYADHAHLNTFWQLTDSYISVLFPRSRQVSSSTRRSPILTPSISTCKLTRVSSVP